MKIAIEGSRAELLQLIQYDEDMIQDNNELILSVIEVYKTNLGSFGLYPDITVSVSQ